MLTQILCALVFLFAVLWGVTFFFYYRLKKIPKNLSLEAQDLLADIMSSGAVVRLEVLDPKRLLYYRGR